MSLIFNGVTIPEDSANALAFNGVDITKVMLNGVNVWEQQLFSATWSGSSTATSTENQAYSYVETSGSLIRHTAYYNNNYSATQFSSINTDGTFTTGTRIPVPENCPDSIGYSLEANHVNRGYNSLTRYHQVMNQYNCTAEVLVEDYGALVFDLQNNIFSYIVGANGLDGYAWATSMFITGYACIEVSGSQMRAVQIHTLEKYYGNFITVD